MSESATKLNAPAKSASILDEIFWDIKHGDEAHQKWLRERLAGFEDKLANALIAAYGDGLSEGVRMEKSEESARDWERKEDASLLGYLKLKRGG